MNRSVSNTSDGLNIRSSAEGLLGRLADSGGDLAALMADYWKETTHRWRNRAMKQALWKAALEEFEADYARAYAPDLSRNPDVGRPFLLMPRIPARAGIVLVHGYMAAPLEVRALGNYLRDRHFAVLGVRLKGHGTAPEDLASRHYEEWYASVLRGIELMEQITGKIGVCGFSAGGDLALLAAARLEKRIRAVATVCAPLRLRNRAAALAPSIVRVNAFMKRIGLNRFQWDYIENRPENPHINYSLNPLSGVETLRALMQETENALPKIQSGLLVVQASEDPVVHPESAAEIFNLAGTRDKTLLLLSRDRHGIVNGEGSEAVFDALYRFFALHLLARARRPVKTHPEIPASAIPALDVQDEPAASSGNVSTVSP